MVGPDGAAYPSLAAAERAAGLPANSLWGRIRRGRGGWRYTDAAPPAEPVRPPPAPPSRPGASPEVAAELARIAALPDRGLGGGREPAGAGDDW